MGIYIAIEGVDGSGKTTQVESLVSAFCEQSSSFKVVRFQRFLSWPAAKLAKKRGVSVREIASSPVISFLESIDDVLTYWLLVCPKLVAGKNVVRDRCGLTRLVNAEVFKTSRSLVSSVLAFCPVPQETFVLAVTPRIAIERADAKLNRSPDDTDSYISSAADVYAAAASFYPHVTTIDGIQSPQEISQKIIRQCCALKARPR